MNTKDTIKHLEKIQGVAAKIEGGGLIVLSVYGQNTTSGENLSPIVLQYDVNNLNFPREACQAIKQLKVHQNPYLGLHVMRYGLPAHSRGGLKDIVAVLGFVLDFDDNDAPNWPNRIPAGLTPSYVLETSLARFQVGFLLDQPLCDLTLAKTIAASLKNYSQCDHGTSDLAHVWRIAGTLNYPNLKKIRAGRSPEPQLVQFVRVQQ